jgi:hypothetical protein
MRSRLARLASVVVAAALGSTPLPARAEGDPPAPEQAPGADVTSARSREASDRFDRALVLFREGDLSAALIEFRTAYDLVPSYKVLYNIGLVEFQLRDYPRALLAFRRYLADGDSEIAAPRRAEVEAYIATLRMRVSSVSIVTNVSASIAIDDEPVGESPLAMPLLVGAGRHKITAQREGYAPVTRILDIAGARDERIAIDLVAVLGAPPAIASPSTRVEQSEASPARESTSPRARMTLLSWIGVGAAGALAAGATVTGVIALNRSNDLTRAPPPASQAAGDRANVKTLAALSDVMWGAAVVTLGTTLVLTFTSGGESAPRVSLHAGAGRLQITGTW